MVSGQRISVFSIREKKKMVCLYPCGFLIKVCLTAAGVWLALYQSGNDYVWVLMCVHPSQCASVCGCWSVWSTIIRSQAAPAVGRLQRGRSSGLLGQFRCRKSTSIQPSKSAGPQREAAQPCNLYWIYSFPIYRPHKPHREEVPAPHFLSPCLPLLPDNGLRDSDDYNIIA